jgi:hypothetical protein
MSAVQNLMAQFEGAVAPDNHAHDEEQKIGTLLVEGGGAGADIWAYNEDGDTWIEFRGWRSDGSWWCVDCHVDESINETLKAVCSVVHAAPVQYIRVTSIVYSVDMPDCSVTRSATLNQCMDFPDQRWIDVRDQDEWYDVNMVVRRC